MNVATSRLMFGAAAAAVLTLSGCGSDNSSTVATSTTSNVNAPTTTHTDGSELMAVADALNKRGVPVPNPELTTSKDCAAIGCISRLDSATITLTRFPTSGKAEIYYATLPNGSGFQQYSLVVEFDPKLTPQQRTQYQQAIAHIIG